MPINITSIVGAAENLAEDVIVASNPLTLIGVQAGLIPKTTAVEAVGLAAGALTGASETGLLAGGGAVATTAAAADIKSILAGATPSTFGAKIIASSLLVGTGSSVLNAALGTTTVKKTSTKKTKKAKKKKAKKAKR